MSHTFVSSLPSAKDRIRLRVGDFNGLPQWFLEDESIIGLLTAYPKNEEEVAAQCAETIGAICSQLGVETQQRNLKIKYEGRAKMMFDLADRIRKQASPPPGSPPNYGALDGKTCYPDLTDYDSLLGVPFTPEPANPVPCSDPTSTIVDAVFGM